MLRVSIAFTFFQDLLLQLVAATELSYGMTLSLNLLAFLPFLLPVAPCNTCKACVTAVYSAARLLLDEILDTVSGFMGL